MTQRSLKKLFVCRLHLNAILRKCQWKSPRGHYPTTWFILQKNKCHFTYKLEFRRTDWYEQLSDLIYVFYTVNIQRQKVKQYLCFAFSKQVDYEASRLCRRFSSCSLFYFLLFFCVCQEQIVIQFAPASGSRISRQCCNIYFWLVLCSVSQNYKLQLSSLLLYFLDQ